MRTTFHKLFFEFLKTLLLQRNETDKNYSNDNYITIIIATNFFLEFLIYVLVSFVQCDAHDLALANRLVDSNHCQTK